MERYNSPHPLPQGTVRELLVILMEECAEVSIAASKALRFGLADGYPGGSTTNAMDLSREMADLVAVFEMLREQGVGWDISEKDKQAKREKLAKFMRHPS